MILNVIFIANTNNSNFYFFVKVLLPNFAPLVFKVIIVENITHFLEPYKQSWKVSFIIQMNFFIMEMRKRKYLHVKKAVVSQKLNSDFSYKI